ncbi:5-formyltetrahydrofolate cyclo-ligase [Fructobacillus sp. M2-14]|uniref:5-formyltetrahydrofolate cyclo-ligase n=1 Tax=Fructobacillus broussonetiae TaxID=2713173 RepID=A0ABS5QYE2_9LACO|nr:5-formyltetrahydrofolate cyclo-ligase [Fructobacillus broussonetiae]MBS9338208.1 5-formyltetrahydrofolate cyclo-ligase [Fructobacillus broussonetiae]
MTDFHHSKVPPEPGTLLAKSLVRNLQKERLQTLANDSASLKRQQEQRLYDLLYQTKAWQAAHTIAVTSSLPFEVNTMPVIKRAWQENKRVTLARVGDAKRLTFHRYTEDTKLVPTKPFGLLEPANTAAVPPSEIDLVLAPGLAFDSDSHVRLGFGGGYYDRFLQNYQGTSLSLALSEQVIHERWPVDAFDVPVDIIIQ